MLHLKIEGKVVLRAKLDTAIRGPHTGPDLHWSDMEVKAFVWSEVLITLPKQLSAQWWCTIQTLTVPANLIRRAKKRNLRIM